MTADSPMTMRERLAIDYHWTARQRQVLDLIREGRTNAQIAETLGVSLQGASRLGRASHFAEVGSLRRPTAGR